MTTKAALPTMRGLRSVFLCLILGVCFLGIDSWSSVQRNSKRRPFPTALSVGSWFAGVTGMAPPSLFQPEWEKGLISGTSLEGVKLECSYKASRDGWSAIDFHRAVDDKGSGLVFVLSRDGKVFGGFNPVGWRSTDDYFNSNAAFLWHTTGPKSVVRSPVLVGGSAAVFDYATGGPCFGAADLVLGRPQAAVLGGFAGPDMMNSAINAGSLKEGSSVPGGAFEPTKGWPVSGKFQLVEVEVYCNTESRPQGGGSPQWWPF